MIVVFFTNKKRMEMKHCLKMSERIRRCSCFTLYGMRVKHVCFSARVKHSNIIEIPGLGPLEPLAHGPLVAPLEASE